MNYWMWLVSLVGILSTAVVLGTDMFFLTIGRSALRLASPSAGTEIMGFFHMFADARHRSKGSERGWASRTLRITRHARARPASWRQTGCLE